MAIFRIEAVQWRWNPNPVNFSIPKILILTIRRYIAVRPPSITSSLPVMKDASSDAKNSTP